MTTLTEDELKYWIAFNQFSYIGPKRFAKILNYYPDVKTAWSSSRSELLATGLKEKIVDKFITERNSIDPGKVLSEVYRNKINILTIKDPTYPQLLNNIPNPPVLIYYQGEAFKEQDNYSLAVVGARKISPYGQQTTEGLVRGLSQNGLVIVSGLALGVDAAAHTTCIAHQGRTIAVLGSGLDKIYPSTHTPLARRIVDTGGLMISEFPLGTPSYRSNFPHRNRIIAGLTRGTLIIEATKKSGSLITAQLALEFNREVFAVPGSIYSELTQGPHALIKQGAQLVTSAQDIMQALNLSNFTENIQARSILPQTPEEQLIVDLLSASTRTVDELIKNTKLDAKKINSILVSMELKGLIRSLGSQNYTMA